MTETEFHSGPRELGPDRFQRRRAAREKRGVLRALGAGVVLLALVAGLPALLVWLDGAPPVPTSVPTREDLTRAIGPDELVTVMVGVAWLAWLQFTICVLVELRSAVSGVGLPARVPLSGPSQRFARALVGAVLLAATAVGPATAAPATAAPAGPVAAEAVAMAAPAVAAPVSGTDAELPAAALEAVEEGRVSYLLGDTVLDPADGAKLVDRKVYRVQPPEGRYHDNLWDIAERHLGDGRRYKEIFELNRGRTQPDGHELSLARLIYPDWLLVMPEDADGVDRVTAVTAEPESAPEQDPAPEPEPGPQPGPEQDRHEYAEVGQDAAAHVVAPDVADEGIAAEQVESSGAHRYRELVLGGLLAAGLLAAVETARRRRRLPEPADAAVEAEVALRVGADPDRASWLDRALRMLAHGCREQHAPLPPVYAAVVDAESVDLLLAPPVATAPAPWQVLDEGRRWRLDRREPSTGGGGAADPYPGLVSLGRDAAGRDVLIDLEAAGGPVAVVGDPTAAYEVVTAVAAELATNRWSDHLRVTGNGLPAELAALDEHRYRRVDDLAAVLTELGSKRAELGGADVLTGRARWAGSAVWVPEYVVLGGVPEPEVSTALLELTGGSTRAPLGVVCAGELPGARWRLSVDAAGNLELPLLAISVTANRLSGPAVRSVASLVLPDEDRTDAAVPTSHEAWLPEARPPVSAPEVESDVALLATAPVRVFVLGPVEVQAPGTIEADRRELATEIVVHLALHREGIHPTLLAASIWPRGVPNAVREAAVERVREWLGTDPDGSPYLLTTPDGRLRLSSDVAVDWEVVQTLLARSRTVHDRAAEIGLLRRALRVARGPVLSERPQGRYAWIARVRLERTASDLLVDAAHRLSMLCLDGGDPGTAGAAARAGIRVRPGEQLLWRDLLQVEHALRGRDGVVAVTEEMTTTLGELGVAELEPETMALLEEYLPADRQVQGELG